MDLEAILNQIDRALEKWASIEPLYWPDISTVEVTECFTLLAAAVRRIAPPGSAYLESAADAFEHPGDIYRVPVLAGVLRALRADYEGGYLDSVYELIHADVFSDFLEMADHLLGEGYKDPAAVLAGGVLEEHLRKLCEKVGIPTDANGRARKADTLNGDLAGKGAYTKLDLKSVTAWLDLRNKAAHAKYDEYTGDQVALMVQGIRDFISRHPA